MADFKKVIVSGSDAVLNDISGSGMRTNLIFATLPTDDNLTKLVVVDSNGQLFIKNESDF
tara:strand:- start:16 stop:195 length:180 start_codon:yes stop_codon:yes gene_type:complete